jgi:hypothetical protein
MPGGLLQLSITGIDFINLEYNKINTTFFKKVYRTYSNFSIQDLSLYFKSKVGFDKINSLVIPNSGDLLQNLILKVTLPELTATYNNDKLTEINNQKNTETYTLSPSNISYILERCSEILNNNYSIVNCDNFPIKAYNWLIDLEPSLILTQNNILLPDAYISQPINNNFKKYLNNLNLSSINNTNFYYPLNMQYLLQVLDNNAGSNDIIPLYNLFSQFVTTINNSIITNNELLLIKYIENKQTNYTLSSLDSQYHYDTIKINISFSVQTNNNFESLIYCYRNNNLVDILVNKSITGNYTMTTEKYFNNTNIIESDISTNNFENKIYYIASRYQVINSQDLNQILSIKYIKSRTLAKIPTINDQSNWNITYTTNPNQAIEWEITILLDPSTLQIIPNDDISSNPINIYAAYNLLTNINNIGQDATNIEINRTKYLVYIYNSLSPENQDIKDLQGNYVTDTNQKQYFIDQYNNFISIRCYFNNISIKTKNFIPLLFAPDFVTTTIFKYNRAYFLDANRNFILIKEFYTDPDGNQAVLVDLPDKINPNISYTYFIDTSGNYRGPINSYSDISGNYIQDTNPYFIIDLISINTENKVIENKSDISRNLIPVFDFINKGKSFSYIYKGRYYNYDNIYFSNPNNKPTNLIDEFPYLPPFAVMALQTYHNNKIILRKINLDQVQNGDYLFNTASLKILNGDSEFATVYNNTMYDISNNIYTINSNEVFLNNQFIYYWNQTLIDPVNNITYTTNEHWQDRSLSTSITDTKQLIQITNINTTNINLDVYQNYQYLINNVNSNYQNYQIYNYLTSNITTTVTDNYNIIRNLFNNLFNQNIYFSQYVATISTNVVLQTNFVTEHLTNFANGLTTSVSNNFNNFINTVYKSFKDTQDLLFLKAISSISNSSNFIKLAGNNLSVPCIKFEINSINNTGLLQQAINIVYASTSDPNQNPININLFNNNILSDNTNIYNFILNNNSININNVFELQNDVDILNNLNIFNSTDLSLNTFTLNGWTIIDYDLNSVTNKYTLYCIPPSYTEYKKILLFQYIVANTQKFFNNNNNSLYVIFNVSSTATELTLLADRVRPVLSWDYIFYNKPDTSTNVDNVYVNKNRSVTDSKDKIVFMNSIFIDLYRYMCYTILNKLTTLNITLQILFTNNLWHLLQDILFFNNSGNATMNRLSLPGNILAINNFSNIFTGNSIKYIISSNIENQLTNIKTLCITFLQNKSFIIKNEQTIYFYSVNLTTTFTPNSLDIELTNQNPLQVIQWFIYYLSSLLRTFYINNTDITFWATFNNYANIILTGLTLPALNYFVYMAIINNVVAGITPIYYNINQMMMYVYTILDGEIISDTVNNITYTLSASDTLSNSFGTVYYLNQNSIYTILVTYFNNYLDKLISNYTYSGVINYYTSTVSNYCDLYSNIFNNISNAGLDSYILFNELQVTCGFNWNQYIQQLNFPRLNRNYDYTLDYNLQVQTIYYIDKIYFQYELLNQTNILTYIDNVIAQSNDITNKYSLYKNILNINNLDQVTLLSNYVNTFGDLNSESEFRRAIEWGIYSGFSNNNGILQLYNNVLGFYDNSNNLVLNYAEYVLENNNIVQVLIKKNLFYSLTSTSISLIKNGNRIYSYSNILLNQNVSNADININNVIYKISNNKVYDFNNNIQYIIIGTSLYQVVSLVYTIVNNKLIGSGIYSGLNIIPKCLYDANTNIIYYQLDYNVRSDYKLNAVNLRSTFGIINMPLIENTLNNCFSNLTTSDIINNASYQLINIDYNIPILINLLIRNSLFSSSESWETFLLCSSWNNVIVTNNYFGSTLPTDIINSVNKYNLQYWNVTTQKVVTDITTVSSTDVIQIIPKYIKYTNASLTDTIVSIGDNLTGNLNNIDNTITKQTIFDNLFNNTYQNTNSSYNILPFGFSYQNNKLVYSASYNVDYLSNIMCYNKFNTFLKNRYLNIVSNSKIINRYLYDYNQLITILNISQTNNFIYVTINNIEITINSFVGIYKNNDIYGPIEILDITTGDETTLKLRRGIGFIYEQDYDYKLVINLPRPVINYNWQDYYKQDYIPYKISSNVIDIIQDLSIRLNVVIKPELPDQITTFTTLGTINTNLQELITIVDGLPTTDTILTTISDISSSLVTINKNVAYTPTLYSNLSNLIDISNNMTTIIPFVSAFNNVLTAMKGINFTTLNNQITTIGSYAKTLKTFTTQSTSIVTLFTKLNLAQSTLTALRTFFINNSAIDIAASLTSYNSTLFNGFTIGDLSDNIILFQQVAALDNTLVNTVDISSNTTLLTTYGTSWTSNINNLNDFNNSIGNLNILNDVSANITNFFNIFNSIQANIIDISNNATDLSNNNILDTVNLIADVNNLTPIIQLINNLTSLNGLITTFENLGTTLDIFTKEINNVLNIDQTNYNNVVEQLRTIITDVPITNIQLNKCISILTELSNITNIYNKLILIKTDIDALTTFFTILPSVATIARSFPSLIDIKFQKENNIPFVDLYTLYNQVLTILNYFNSLYGGIQNILGSFNLTAVSPIIAKLNFIATQMQTFINFENLSITTINIINSMTAYGNNNAVMDTILTNNLDLSTNIANFTNVMEGYFIPLDYVGTQTTMSGLAIALPSLQIYNININPVTSGISSINNIVINLQNIQSINFTIYNITYDEPVFYYIFLYISNFILYLDNIDNLTLLGNLDSNGALSNNQIITNNLSNIYQMISVIESLQLFETNLLNDPVFKYKLNNWVSDNNSIYGSILDPNTFLEINDWILLNSDKMLIADIYSINFNNTKYDIIQIVYNNNFTPTTNYTLQSGLGYILDTTLLNDNIFFDIFNHYNNTTDYSLLLSDYNSHSIITNFNQQNIITTDTTLKNTILNNIITTIPDSSSLLFIWGDSISRQINHGFNSFRFTTQTNISELYTDFKNSLNTKISNITVLYSILNRPANPRIAWINYVGHYLIKYIRIYINDFLLEELSGDWIHIASLFEKNSKLYSLNKLIGNTQILTSYTSNIKPVTDIYIPLPFYFQKFPSLALPLIAMFNSKIIVTLKTNTFENLIYIENYSSPNISSDFKIELIGRFIYLDGPERDLFGSSQHEYLIEQIQYKYIPTTSSTNMIDINSFFNPIKDIFFVYSSLQSLLMKQYWNYTASPYYECIDNDLEYNLQILLKYPQFKKIYNKMQTDNKFYYLTGIKPGLWGLTHEQRNSLKTYINNLPNYYPANPVLNSSIYFNGHYRFKVIEGAITGLIYPYKIYHRGFKPGVNVYPFCLYPHECSPTGYASFTYLNDKKLECNFNTPVNGIIKVYARSYNILRIKSGLVMIAM